MGLLDGDIANLVAGALAGAGMSKAATLTKVTPGIRNPTAVTAGTNPTSQSYSCQGLPVDTRTLQLSGTLIAGVDRAFRLFGATLPAGVTPAPGDRITMDGATAVIEAQGVSVDPAKATYLCQCRS